MNAKIGKVGSTDVAKLAGVSRSAVSRTFTPGAYVSQATREKVLKAAESLGYQPNILARSLTTNRSNIIGVITSNMENPFYAALLQELIDRLHSKGLAPLVLPADETDNDNTLTQLLSYQVDGIIVTNAHLASRRISGFAKANKPVIALNRYTEMEGVTAVTCDNVASSAQVADLLVNMGKKNIAFIAGLPDTSSSRDRERGFTERLVARKTPLFAKATGYYTHSGGLDAARQLFSGPLKPDAIFAANDLMAFAAIEVIEREQGLKIPHDVCVVGFDNSDPANWPSYKLTSVDQNAPRMVDVTVDEIIARLSGEKQKTRHYNVLGKIVLRNSTHNVKSD